MAEQMNIFQRIAEVMKAVAYVQKDADVGFGKYAYKAVSHDKVISTVRQACIDNGVVIYPSQQGKGESVLGKTAKGADKIRFEAVYDVHFVSITDSADRITVTVEAHAEDSGDKATGKAISYATKYAILKTFLIETGENDESRIEQEEKKKPAPKPEPTEDQKNYKRIAGALNSCKTMAELDSVWSSEKAAIDKMPQAGRDKLTATFEQLSLNAE